MTNELTREQKSETLAFAKKHGYVFDPDTWTERYETLFTLKGSQEKNNFVDHWFDEMVGDAIDWLVCN